MSLTTEYVCDAPSRVTASSQTTGGVTYIMPEYRYDKAGNLVSQKYPSGKVVETQYDEASRVAGVRRQGGVYYAGGDPGEAGRPNVIRYAVHGGVSALRLGNGLWEHTLYNKRLQPYEIGLGRSSGDSSVLKLEYGYGLTGVGAVDSIKNNGNVRGQRISVPAEGSTPAQTFTQVYTYDALNRLEAAVETSAAHTTWRQVYTYDHFGNRRLDSGQTTSPKLTEPGQTVAPALANPSLHLATNRIAEDQDGDGNKEYTYDAAGSLTCDAQRCAPSPDPTPHYAYDAEDRMTAAGGGSGSGGSSYMYDGDGRRVRKALAGGEVTVFVYDAAGRLVAEYSNQVSNNGTRYLTHDHLGSTRVVIDAQGNAHSINGAGGSRHDYLPFGEEIQAGTGGRTTQQGYAGDNLRQKWAKLERDNETGLDYAVARYYSPTQGRFVSPDPALSSGKPPEPQSWNRYAYAINNPLKYIDPSGLVWGSYTGNDRKTYYHWFKDDKELEASGATAVKFYQGRFMYKSVNGDWVRLLEDSAKWSGGYADEFQAFYGTHGSTGDNSTGAGQALGLSVDLTASKIIGAVTGRAMGAIFSRGGSRATGEVAEEGGDYIYRTIGREDPHLSQFRNVGDKGFINPRGGHNDLTLHVQEGNTNSIFTSWSRSRGANWAQWGEPGSVQLRLDTRTLPNHALDVSKWSRVSWEREVTVIGPVRDAVRVK